MGLVEDILQFRVAVEHALIEVRGKRNAVLAKHGNGSFDELNLAGRQHGQGSPAIKKSSGSGSACGNPRALRMFSKSYI